ncbi:MAG TPA: hypothetical protein ENJ95_01335 [Bacteroidetes bacterium]|nr:hypothetical protein [Bacteroidota bacterium]
MNTIVAQTCCSGGVPLAANLGLPPVNAKTMQFRLSYDLNLLENLKTGRESLDDNSRSRRTHSVLFELGYSLTKRFSIDGMFTWVRQEREINQFGNRDLTATNGTGDAVFLLKYKAIASEKTGASLTTGIGLKAPVGPSALKRSDGLTIVADLQPGSGAWDLIFWNQYAQALAARPSMGYSLLATYAVKGTNDEYLGSEEYSFGNELQLAASLGDRIFLGKMIFDPSLEIRYRHAQNDQQNGETVPSTGGDWLFVTPAMSYWFNPDFSVSSSISIPVFADIVGTQLTPSWRFNFSIFHRLSFYKNQDKTNLFQ